MCQWTGWKAVFSVGSASKAVDATMDTTIEELSFCAVRAEGLYVEQS